MKLLTVTVNTNPSLSAVISVQADTFSEAKTLILAQLAAQAAPVNAQAALLQSATTAVNS